MPRGVRNNENKDSAEKKTRTVRPKLTDEQKAIAEVEKLRPRVQATEDKLKKVRAEAATLDEALKADQKLLNWALQNPFLPEGYGDQADVPAGDAPVLTAVEGEQSTEGEQSSEEESAPASEDELPGADQLGDADENLGATEETAAPAEESDDPFANFQR